MSSFGCTTSRDVVRVSGPDAASFLQGQLSQDVDGLAVSTSTWTFVLRPEGKVHTWCRLTKTAADAFVLDTDHGAGPALVERLSRFLIRTKADIEEIDLPAVSVRGADAPRGDVPDGVLRLPIAGADGGGYDLLGPGAAIPDGVEVADEHTLEIHRVEHGVPAMGRELTEETIPAEIGQWIVDQSVSFTKGCFVGQELVARIDSRGGNVPRHLRAIVLDTPVEVGTTVEADGPPATVTSSVVSPRFGPVALAFLGRRVEPGDAVHVGGVAGTVRGLPLTDA